MKILFPLTFLNRQSALGFKWNWRRRTF